LRRNLLPVRCRPWGAEVTRWDHSRIKADCNKRTGRMSMFIRRNFPAAGRRRRMRLGGGSLKSHAPGFMLWDGPDRCSLWSRETTLCEAHRPTYCYIDMMPN